MGENPRFKDSGVTGKPNQRKASSRTFRRGIPEQKFNVNRACFPKEKHQNSQKWAKFMNFSFWPFLWFGLPGRLLKDGHARVETRVFKNASVSKWFSDSF